MPITRGVLAQSPKPEAHDKVLDNNPDRIGIWECWFMRRGKTGVPGEKPLGARTRTNNKLNPYMTPSPGIEPGPHWWEACVGGKCSTTAPSLLSNLFTEAILPSSVDTTRYSFLTQPFLMDRVM